MVAVFDPPGLYAFDVAAGDSRETNAAVRHRERREARTSAASLSRPVATSALWRMADDQRASSSEPLHSPARLAIRDAVNNE